MSLIVSQDAQLGIWNLQRQGLFDPFSSTSPVFLPLDAPSFIMPGASPLPALPSNQTFHLSFIKGIAIQLAIERSAANFASRANLRPQFDDFIQQVERAEGATVRPGATRLIHKLVADQLPSTFDESAYFQYGYFRGTSDNVRTFVDLHPGMRLRIDSQAGQLTPTPPASSADGGFSFGYVPAGTAYCDLVETLSPAGIPLLAFDAFFASAMLPLVNTNANNTNAALAGGVLDLQSALRQKRWFRICYPPNFLAGDSVLIGDASQNIALIGADTLAILSAATDAYYTKPLTAVNGSVMAVFRGRVTLVPEITVFVNNTPLYVPVGTTVRNLLSRFMVLPRFADFALRVTYKRTVVGPNFFGDDANPFPNFVSMIFQKPDPNHPSATTAFDLPVLAGDQCSFL
jgi:hypothetical protein